MKYYVVRGTTIVAIVDTLDEANILISLLGSNYTIVQR